MRKAFRLLLALAVMLTVVLGLGVCASADGLPREKVGYGFGMPEAAAVPAHDLTDEGLTLDGVSFNARIEDGRVYIRIVDLAAVNLLRENASAAEELGLDSSDLYIERGLILVKPDGKTAEEIAGVEAKLAALKAQSAPIGVSVGDEYILASGGVDRLIVEVGELVYPSSTTAETPEKADISPSVDGDSPKPKIDVKAGSSKEYTTDVSVTTVYFSYGDEVAKTNYLATASDLPGDNPSYNYETDIVSRNGNILIVRGENDTNDYYIFIEFSDDSNDDIYGEFKFGGNDPWSKSIVKYAAGEFSDENPHQDKLAKRILISTDGTKGGVVKTILLNDTTPDADKFFKENSNEPADLELANGILKYTEENTPDGYTCASKDGKRSEYSGNKTQYYDKTDTNLTPSDSNKVLYGYEYELDETDAANGSRIDVVDAEAEETTVNVKNDVMLVTEADVCAEKPEIYPPYPNPDPEAGDEP